jgi:hypothetical protein
MSVTFFGTALIGRPNSDHISSSVKHRCEHHDVTCCDVCSCRCGIKSRQQRLNFFSFPTLLIADKSIWYLSMGLTIMPTHKNNLNTFFWSDII